MKELLPNYTEHEYLAYMKKWEEKGFDIGDSVIREVFNKYPNNDSPKEVEYKVGIINYLYHAGLPEIHKESMAKHICTVFEKHKENPIGSYSELVEEIARLEIEKGGTIRYITFASKYCHFCFPNEVPIYDSYVVEIISEHPYFKDLGNSTAKIKQKLQENYKEYSKAVFGLLDTLDYIPNIKMLDQYLWLFADEKKQAMKKGAEQ